MKHIKAGLFTSLCLLIVGACCQLGTRSRTTSNADVVHEDQLYAATLSERSALVGKRAEIEDAKVGVVDGDYTFWVGPAARPVPVVLRREKLNIDPEPRVEVRTGQTLQLTGTLQRTRDVLNELKLTPREREALSKHEVYLSANRVRGAN